MRRRHQHDAETPARTTRAGAPFTRQILNFAEGALACSMGFSVAKPGGSSSFKTSWQSSGKLRLTFPPMQTPASFNLTNAGQ
jgi:hypothetical protein